MDAPTARSALPPELQAPEDWRCLEFISDVHLNPDEPDTAAAWRRYLATTRAQAVFVLGDLFEVWIGDDVLAGHSAGARFARDCVAELRALGAHSALFLMHGNRDFLMGQPLAQACGATLLDDPTVLVLGAERVLLSHGDALCLDDPRYLAFRAEVRSPAWQQTFLARPLDEREALARQLRTQSRDEQAQRHASGQGYADVDQGAALQALVQARAHWLLHGHTHRPGRHALNATHHREVLSDWDAHTHPPRAQVLRLERQPGARARLTRLDLLA